MTQHKLSFFCIEAFLSVVFLFSLPLFVFAVLEDERTVDVTVKGGAPPVGTPVGGTQPPVDAPLGGTPPVGQLPPAGTSSLPPAATDFTVGGLLTRAEGILNLIIPFIIGLAVVTILWGIFLYVTKAAEEEKRAEARLYIVWGIVAVFCMLSLWGFVNILVNSFNLETTLEKGSIPTAPTL